MAKFLAKLHRTIGLRWGESTEFKRLFVFDANNVVDAKLEFYKQVLCDFSFFDGEYIDDMVNNLETLKVLSDADNREQLDEYLEAYEQWAKHGESDELKIEYSGSVEEYEESKPDIDDYLLEDINLDFISKVYPHIDWEDMPCTSKEFEDLSFSYGDPSEGNVCTLGTVTQISDQELAFLETHGLLD